MDELGSRAAMVKALLVASPAPERRARLVRAEARARRFLGDTSLRNRAEYLTGTSAQLQAVWKAYGVARPSAGERAFLASPTILLIDRAGFERVGFALEQLTPEALAHDIDTLLVR